MLETLGVIGDQSPHARLGLEDGPSHRVPQLPPLNGGLVIPVAGAGGVVPIEAGSRHVQRELVLSVPDVRQGAVSDKNLQG
jgi:hypothetical protein